ncbi:MAG: hypothetical protein BYD32DRAFT_464440 [Podila humilis]|nr:MAG: hypothetical protein BYD32DRAFT_464440 [Podila humilis]
MAPKNADNSEPKELNHSTAITLANSLTHLWKAQHKPDLQGQTSLWATVLAIPELRALVASYLHQRDLRFLLEVSRGWYGLWLPEVYRELNIFIRGYRWFQYFAEWDKMQLSTVVEVEDFTATFSIQIRVSSSTYTTPSPQSKSEFYSHLDNGNGAK